MYSIEGVARIAHVHCTTLEGGASISANFPISRIAQASTVISCKCTSEVLLLLPCAHMLTHAGGY